MIEKNFLNKEFADYLKIKKGTLLISILFFFLFLYLPVFNIQAKEYEISNYDVKMRLSEEGDFLVEERITFHFLEGDFSYAYREVKGNVFSDIEFLSIEGVDTSILDYEIDQGKDLNIRWDYDYLGDQATFVFRYIGVGGLQSVNEINVIDWTPTGAEWDIPIRDIDIYITLPWQLEDVEVNPTTELVSDGSGEFHFHSDFLPAGEAYKVYLSFPEMISMENVSKSQWQASDIYLLILIGIAGLVLSIVDILNRNKITASKGKQSINDLLIYEKAVIFNNLYDSRKAVTAQVFRLAKEGKIKLLSSIKKDFLGSKEAEVSVEIIDSNNLYEIEKEIIDGLEKHDTLKKFSQDYKLFSRIDKKLKESMRKKGYISQEAESNRNRIYISFLLFILPSIAAFILGAVYSSSGIIGTAIALLIISIGRIIKGAMVNIFTAEALYLKEEIAAEIEDKKKNLEGFVKGGDGSTALKYFFSEIEYIILQKNFHSGVLDQYKKSFKKADDVELPEWLELDISNLDSTIDALEIVEVVDYLLLSMVFIASNTGTTTISGAGGGGTTGGGGTVGGGGGGAG